MNIPNYLTIFRILCIPVLVVILLSQFEGSEFIETSGQGEIRIILKYDSQGNPAITGLERISKPGLRKFVGKKEISRVLEGLGIAILSTSKGVLTGKEARRSGVGGELLCHIW